MTTGANSDNTVSVIIPCFRQGRFLPESVGSVLQQTHRVHEIIVVDDGSDDDTGQIAAQLRSVKYIWKKNGGPASARNAGISQATGKYLMFLDSDDLLHPEALEWLVTAAAGREDVLPTMHLRFFDHGTAIDSGPVHPFPENLADIYQQLFLHNLNAPVAFLPSRKMVQAVGGFDPSPEVDACEDWELWMRLIFAGAQLRPVHEVGAFYRQHPTSHSSNKIKMKRSRSNVRFRTRQAMKGREQWLRGLGLDHAEIHRRLTRLMQAEHQDAAYWLRQEGKYREAFVHYYRSMSRSKINSIAIVGMLKLLPHWLVHGRKATSTATVKRELSRDLQPAAVPAGTRD